MGIVLGIDIGSSATKIVAMDESKTILSSLKVSASDPVTAMYGAVGKILCEERMQIADGDSDAHRHGGQLCGRGCLWPSNNESDGI